MLSLIWWFVSDHDFVLSWTEEETIMPRGEHAALDWTFVGILFEITVWLTLTLFMHWCSYNKWSRYWWNFFSLSSCMFCAVLQRPEGLPTQTVANNNTTVVWLSELRSNSRLQRVWQKKKQKPANSSWNSTRTARESRLASNNKV